MVPAYEFDVAKMFHERLIGLIDEKKDEVYARSESKKEEIAPNRQMRSKRTPRKFTQKKIAEEMCINEKTFSSYISREKVPRVHEVVTIAQYFGVSTDYLLGISHSKEVEELPRKVREYTGLSDAAVETLLYYKSAKESTLIATINLLLEELGENKSTLDVLHEALSEPEDDSMYEFQFDESEIPEYPEEFYEQAYDEMQADFNNPEYHDIENSFVSGRSVLQLIDTYLKLKIPVSDDYYVTKDGHLVPWSEVNCVDGFHFWEVQACMSGQLLADQYYLGLITDILKQMKGSDSLRQSHKKKKRKK